MRPVPGEELDGGKGDLGIDISANYADAASLVMRIRSELISLWSPWNDCHLLLVLLAIWSKISHASRKLINCLRGAEKDFCRHLILRSLYGGVRQKTLLIR